MRFFYYVKKLGKLWPQASAEHPVSKLNPLTIVGQIVELTEADRHLELRELMQKYPHKEA